MTSTRHQATAQNSYPDIYHRLHAPGRKVEILGMAGASSTLVADLFLKEEVSDDSIGVIWVGRNNLADAQVIANDLETMANHFQSGKFLVMLVLKGRWANHRPGAPGDVRIETVNKLLKSMYPDRTVDPQPVIGCTDFQDNTHLNEDGRSKIAELISNELAARHW